MNLKLSMNRISCLISISSFVFFVDVFANQDVYAKADVFFFITGNTFDISFIVIPRFLMNKCESQLARLWNITGVKFGFLNLTLHFRWAAP